MTVAYISYPASAKNFKGRLYLMPRCGLRRLREVLLAPGASWRSHDRVLTPLGKVAAGSCHRARDRW